MSTPLEKFLNLIAQKFPASQRGDIYAKGKEVYKSVENFLSANNCLGRRAEVAVAANEAIQFETVAQATGIESLENFVAEHVATPYVRPAMEAVCSIMSKCLGQGTAGAWAVQNLRADHNDGSKARELNSMYTAQMATELLSHTIPSTEAFGTNIDMAVPDMKVAITVAIMNFHTGLVPRMLQTRTIAQPNVSYTKEYLEVYDLSSVDGFRKRLLELYFDPTLVRNELQKIVPRIANEADQTNPQYIVSATYPTFLKFGVSANLLKLSLQTGNGAQYGHTRINRTDTIAEGVRLESVLITLTKPGDSEATPPVEAVSESFIIQVPISTGRLTRVINGPDSALRNADVRFRAFLQQGAVQADGQTPSVLLSGLTPDVEGVVVELVCKPTISLKFGDVDCMGTGRISLRHINDNADLSVAAKALSDLQIKLEGYTLDAKFSEENLRKTNIAIWSNRVPFSFDIPIGRNYVFDYAIGQVNAEENATNLTKVIRLGQDDVALRLIKTTLEHVYNLCKEFETTNPVDKPQDPGLAYVAGDRVRPYVWQGTLKLGSLNVIRDSDRSGDIKQKAVSMLTAVTSRILQKSLFQYQLNGAQVVFNVICSPEALGNVFSMPMIYQHFNKEEIQERDGNGGIDYVMVLPNGVKLQFITSTFDYMVDQLIMFPIIPGNAESELNFAHNWDYGMMVAHYTPSGAEAHHRLFGNIRELPIVVNPIGAIISIDGMEVANFLANENELRPSINATINGSVTTVEG